MVDCDLKNSNIALHLGLYDFPLTLQDVLEQDINFLESIYIHSSGLRIVPASLSLREFKTEIAKLKNVLDGMNQHFLLDTPSGINEDVVSVLKLCNEIVVITTPDIPSLTDSMKTIQMAKDLGKRVKGIIVNRVEMKNEIKIEDIERVCGLPVIGVVPEDKNMKRSLHLKVPLVRCKPHSSSAVAIKKIAANLIERDYSPPWHYRIRSLFG